LLARLERRSERMHGLRIDYAASYWTPPMTPKLAFELETRQVEKLNLRAMVSITDHDTITRPCCCAPFQCAQIPVSVEWSAPYGNQSFTGRAQPAKRQGDGVDETLAEYTANPSDKRLTEILKALDEEPNVLVVFTTLCGLYLIGAEKHQFLVNEFLQINGNYLHALELNACATGREPGSAAAGRTVEHAADLRRRPPWRGAERQHQPDNAVNFTEFVHEIGGRR